MPGDMDILHLVDPALRPLLDAWPTMTVSADNLAEARARAMPFPQTEVPGVAMEERRIPGPAGAPDIGLRVYRPVAPAGPVGCIYHIHGGGYIMGSASDVDFAYRPLAAALGCVIVSVDYRLAPEAVFPAAIEDCYAGLGWVFANADALGIDPKRTGVMGESAGGGLAAALALLARDRGEHRLAFQHLVYPMLDDRTGVLPSHAATGQFIWNRESNRFAWGAFLGREPGGSDISPYAAAARAGDLTGLPPSFVMAGALDLFVDEDIEYARRLVAAGIPTELHVYPGAFHGFDAMPGIAVADQARADRLAALRRVLA